MRSSSMPESSSAGHRIIDAPSQDEIADEEGIDADQINIQEINQIELQQSSEYLLSLLSSDLESQLNQLNTS